MTCMTREWSVDSRVGPSRPSSTSHASYRPYPSSPSCSRSSTPAFKRHKGMASDSLPYVDSQLGSLRVFAYSPPQGLPGATITTNIEFVLRSSETIYLRLVLGRRALTTSVRRLPDRRFELQARVPLDYQPGPVPSVLSLSTQALNSNDELLDSVTFGKFVVMNTNPTFSDVGGVLGESVLPIKRSRGRKGRAEDPPIEVYPSNHYMQDFCGGGTSRPPKKPSVIRTRRSVSGDQETEAKCASLVLEGNLETISCDWTKDELAAGRRLVRFSRVQEGSTLKVSFAIIKQEEYSEGDAVISCIYRKDTDCCFVTSVDIILLLERLVTQEFDIEEKNRIRRNLEGFRPKTVSKNRQDTSEFFLHIMNFPAPKPRNIEKDLKVFDWKVLSQALEKIISRYTLPVSKPQSTSRVHSPARSVPSSASSTRAENPTLPSSRTRSPSDYSSRSSSNVTTPDFTREQYGGHATNTQFPYVPSQEHTLPPLGDSNAYEDPRFYDAYSCSPGSTLVTTPSCQDPTTYGVDIQGKEPYKYQSPGLLGGTASVSGNFLVDHDSMPSYDPIHSETISMPKNSPDSTGLYL